MERKTFGEMVTALRKEKGMTQRELAERLGVTDKAVSKWERDLSIPDVSAIPILAETFGISVDELMQVQIKARECSKGGRLTKSVALVLRCVAVAMGVAVAVLSVLRKVEVNDALCMLGVGLAALAITQLPQKEE